MSSIAAGTTSGASLVLTGDTVGDLVIKTNGSTTAVTIGTDQAVLLAGTLDVTGSTTVGSVFMEDNLLVRPLMKDYALEGVIVGNTGASYTFDLTNGNYFAATLDQNSTFTFSNPVASGDFCGFILELTNGGAFVITFPASVDWPGGTAPTLTAAGVDQLVFTTRDGGTTWFGFVCGLDIKTPA